jgi:hypothetical protein
VKAILGIALLAGALCAVTLAIAKPADAYNAHGWYWSRTSAEDAVWDEGLPWMRQPEELDDVGCHGIGKWIRSKDGVKMFQRFRCDATYQRGYAVWADFYLYVLGKYNWTAKRINKG